MFFACLFTFSMAMANDEGFMHSEQGVAAKLPEIVFDAADPMASHPEMQELVHSIYERNARRGLTKPATLSTADKQAILDVHNAIRSQTARGEYPTSSGYQPSACNMNSLSWSATLAKVATDWSARCYFEHSTDCNECSETTTECSYRMEAAIAAGTEVEWNQQSSDSCGENLYVSGASPTMTFMYNGRNYGLLGFERSWCEDESSWYSYSKYSFNHYTQVVWADTRYVGCGFSECSGVTTDDDGTKTWAKAMFTCNYYPPGNMYGEYPYEQGTAGSCCDADRTPTSDGLCGGGWNTNFNNDAYTGSKSKVDQCYDGLGRYVCNAAYTADDDEVDGNNKVTAIVAVTLSVAVCIMLIAAGLLCWRAKRKKQTVTFDHASTVADEENENEQQAEAEVEEEEETVEVDVEVPIQTQTAVQT
mmetsp:Transcript_46951/g.75171  ORF Transcript_46951/g.75171 Transcript_46951/m.75171 type:complete len:419 (-) Transcript_46951:153-1409(-)